ncbi:DNA repair protein rhp57 [Savitreella phatthalungensis]
MDVPRSYPGIKLSTAELAAYERHDILAIDLVTTPAEVIAKTTNLSVLSIERVTNQVLEAAEKDIFFDKTLAEMAADPESVVRFMTTGDAGIDEMLSGGIPTRHITELCGESGSGKTQLMAQLCVAVQLPRSLGGFDSDAVYISTEHGLPTKRVADMALATKHRYRDYYTPDVPKLEDTSDDVKPETCTRATQTKSVLPDRPLDHIHQVTCADLELQDHMIYYQLPALLELHNGPADRASDTVGRRDRIRLAGGLSRRPIGIVILDSVAANYRAEYKPRRETPVTDEPGGRRNRYAPAGATTSGRPNDLATRSDDLTRLGAHLRLLARRYDIAIVCTNQVSDRISAPPVRSTHPSQRLYPTTMGPERPFSRRPGSHPEESGDGDIDFTQGGSPPTSSAPPTPVDGSNIDLNRVMRYDDALVYLSCGVREGEGVKEVGKFKVPALGLVWSNQVHTRISLRRLAPRDTDTTTGKFKHPPPMTVDFVTSSQINTTIQHQHEEDEDEDDEGGSQRRKRVKRDETLSRNGVQRLVVRQMSVVYSPFAAIGRTSKFVVAREGVFSVT